ncbi:MAG: sulfite exporter TauE/SafE family protein [Candidatus Nanopelagicales bacterium]
MDAVTIIGLLAAGVAAGAINGVVGAGTLITFPTLLAAGASPVVANGTNTLGLSFGSASSAWAYRTELGGTRAVLKIAVIAGAAGAAFGAILVFALPEAFFAALVPWLILSAVVLVAVQPALATRLRRTAVTRQARPRTLAVAIGGAGIYGGYFGAGQGVVLMGVLGLLYDADPQRANAAKNLMAGVANVTAAVVFVVAGRVWWTAAALIAVGAIVGGTFGARFARRLPPRVMRLLVVVIGVIAAVAVWVGA